MAVPAAGLPAHAAGPGSAPPLFPAPQADLVSPALTPGSLTPNMMSPMAPISPASSLPHPFLGAFHSSLSAHISASLATQRSSSFQALDEAFAGSSGPALGTSAGTPPGAGHDLLSRRPPPIHLVSPRTDEGSQAFEGPFSLERQGWEGPSSLGRQGWEGPSSLGRQGWEGPSSLSRPPSVGMGLHRTSSFGSRGNLSVPPSPRLQGQLSISAIRTGTRRGAVWNVGIGLRKRRALRGAAVHCSTT
jgi:hypothetical protein